jgi:uncharacterized protein YcsI (UPF0317 family)
MCDFVCVFVLSGYHDANMVIMFLDWVDDVVHFKHREASPV